MADRLNLTREQLALITGGDPKAIKQFEKLFGASNLTVEQVQELYVEAALAQSAANEALAQLTRIANALEVLAAAPVPQPAFEIGADIGPNPFIPLSLKDLADIGVSLPETNHILYFEGDTGRWMNIADPTIDTVRFKDVDYYATVQTGNPVLNFATGDYLLYDRTANELQVFIGSSPAGKFTATQFYAPTEVRSPSIKAGDADYYMQLQTGNPILNFATGDYLLYDRAANELQVIIGSNQVGKFTSAQFYVPTEILSPILKAGDNNFNLLISAGNPSITCDINDFIAYNRAANHYDFIIGGNLRGRFHDTHTDIMANGVIKTVEVGAADSGGAGYRMLRVTN